MHPGGDRCALLVEYRQELVKVVALVEAEELSSTGSLVLLTRVSCVAPGLIWSGTWRVTCLPEAVAVTDS
jgi:hypothetical protein